MNRTPLRLLLIEDSENDAELIVGQLRRGGYDPLFERVCTDDAVRAALTRGPWDLVISDYRMPGFSGLDALAMLQEGTIDVPFILVSGAVGEDVAVEAMKAGAHDYVMKDQLTRLAPAVRRELVEADVRRKRRQAETELKKAYEELERRVRDRTAELSQANRLLLNELEERKRLEEERNRMFVQLLRGQKLQAIGQLAAGVAHEINNPAGWILSNLGTLEKYFRTLERLLRETTSAVEESPGPGGDGLREETRRLRTEADADFLLRDFASAVSESKEGVIRIRDIVASLKSFAHPDDAEPEECDLASLVENAIKLCTSELKYKARIEQSFAPDVRIVCRPRQIEQVFVNLLVNAAQAIPERGEIAVSILAKDREALVRVRDTGTGIPPEHLKRLFEPFFTTKPVGKGTGLGLHVAYKIVRSHGGRIDVASTLGEGTEVTVRLPIGREAPRASGEKPLVVLVDDDIRALRALRRALAREPLRILSTRDPAKALSWVLHRDVRLVLSDHRMPDMSGTSLLEEVARRSPATRRLLVTAYPESPEVEEARGGAVDDVISKPWDDRGLRHAVRQRLGNPAEEEA